MPRCVVHECGNQTYQKTKAQINIEKNIKISFHQFPKDEATKLIWIKAMSLDTQYLPKFPSLCSLHFSENDFDRTSLVRTRLKDNAIPTVSTSQINTKNKAIETFQHISHQIPTKILVRTPVSTELTVSNSQIIKKTEATENISRKIPIRISLQTPVSTEVNTSQNIKKSKTVQTFQYISRKIPTEISLQTLVPTLVKTVNTSQINKENKAIQTFEHISHKIPTEILVRTPVSTELTVSTSQINKKTEAIENISHKILTEISLQTSVSTELTSGIGIKNRETQKNSHREENSYDYDEIMLRRRRYCCALDHSYQSLNDTPWKKMFREALSNQRSYYQRKMRILQQRNRRQEKKIIQLNTILNGLTQKKFTDR